jgi:hypothetical protein
MVKALLGFFKTGDFKFFLNLALSSSSSLNYIQKFTIIEDRLNLLKSQALQ